MATIQTRNASVYWSAALVDKTRNVNIDLGTDFVEDTVHGSANRSYAATFTNFNAQVTGLFNTGAAAAGITSQLIRDGLSSQSATWSIYIGNSNTYFYGSGFLGVDAVTAPYDEFAEFNWSIRPSNTVGLYAK